jgi:hypothetical protein
MILVLPLVALMLGPQISAAAAGPERSRGGRGATTITYENVPPEVVRISIHEWQDTASPSRLGVDTIRQGAIVSLRATPERRTLVRFERTDGAYLLDGPFWWPLRDAARPLDRRWRRTVAAAAAEPIPGATDLEWLSAGGEAAGEWPRCFHSGARLWSCWGVPVGETGVLLCLAADRIWWTVVSRAAAPSLRSSKWGRLLVVPGSAAEPAGLRIRFARHVTSSPQRGPGVRLDTAAVANAQATFVAADAAWLSGEDVPAGAWIEVRTARAGPAYVPLPDVAAGPPGVAWTMRLDETRVFDGLVVNSRGERVSGALVTLFRLIDPPRPQGDASKERPRRVLSAETVADAGGAFHLDGIGDADYEVLAWHPQFGRAVVPLPAGGGSLTCGWKRRGWCVAVCSRPASRSAGSTCSVFRRRRPSGRGRSRRSERRRHSDRSRRAFRRDSRCGWRRGAARGGRERCRFGASRSPAACALLDLGDIDLGSPIEISIVLDQESPCDVRATGPSGRAAAGRHGGADRAGSVPDAAPGGRLVGVRIALWPRRARRRAGPGPTRPGQRREGGAFLRTLEADDIPKSGGGRSRSKLRVPYRERRRLNL